MISGRVTLKTDFPNVEFPETGVQPPFPGVAAATIKSTQPTGLVVNIEIENASSMDEAKAGAIEASNYLANVLAFEFGVHVGTPRIDSASFKEEGSDSHHLEQGLNLFCCATAWKSLSPPQCSQVATLCAANAHPGYVYFEMFRIALSLRDPLAQFMALYSLVLQLSSDSQEAVDQFVLSVEPTAPTSPPYRPRRSRVHETVYTRLRNQIGHVRPGTTIEETRNEMQHHLGGLAVITKAIISRQP